MSFSKYLEEAIIPSSPELQTQDSRKSAREAIKISRGKMQGRKVELDDTITANKMQRPQAPKDPVDTLDDAMNDPLSTIIKNTATELVYVIKDEDNNLFITFINKQKMTKRTISLDARGAVLLKRSI